MNFLKNHLFSESIIKTYILLILAICSKQKSSSLEDQNSGRRFPNKHSAEFQKLLELHFKEEKELSFYNGKLHITNNTLSKAVKK